SSRDSHICPEKLAPKDFTSNLSWTVDLSPKKRIKQHQHRRTPTHLPHHESEACFSFLLLCSSSSFTCSASLSCVWAFTSCKALGLLLVDC
ncbi:LOW QUALITY PROTEIN: hypothetical protein PanWU01x14_182960, partial [Parasponia andersonii]